MTAFNARDSCLCLIKFHAPMYGYMVMHKIRPRFSRRWAAQNVAHTCSLRLPLFCADPSTENFPRLSFSPKFWGLEPKRRDNSATEIPLRTHNTRICSVIVILLPSYFRLLSMGNCIKFVVAESERNNGALLFWIIKPSLFYSIIVLIYNVNIVTYQQK